MSSPRAIRSTSAIAPGHGENTRLQSDDKGHLKVGSGSGTVIDVTIVADTNIYADNDVLFISQIVTGVSDIEGGTVKLVNAVLFDGDDQGTEVEVFFTTNATTPGTINGAVAAADTVLDDIVGNAHFITYSDLINSQVCVLKDIAQVMKCAAGSKDLYIFGVVRSGTPTYTAGGLKLKLGFERL
jgi:hypothetical protein